MGSEMCIRDRNALELDYISIGRTYLVIYILLLGLFSFVTVSVSSLQYEASKKRVKEYYLVLQELIRYYEKEEEENGNKEERNL